MRKATSSQRFYEKVPCRKDSHSPHDTHAEKILIVPKDSGMVEAFFGIVGGFINGHVIMQIMRYFSGDFLRHPLTATSMMNSSWNQDIN